jgi:hypothetical protein
MERASERISGSGRNWKGGIFSRKLTTDSVTEVEDDGDDTRAPDSRGF